MYATAAIGKSQRYFLDKCLPIFVFFYLSVLGSELKAIQLCSNSLAPSFTPVPLIAIKPHHVSIAALTNPIYKDPVLSRIRRKGLVEDFKTLADLEYRDLTPEQKTAFERDAAKIKNKVGENASLLFLLHNLYVKEGGLLTAPRYLTEPKVRLESSAGADYVKLLDYVENKWRDLAKTTRVRSKSSRIPLPYPFVIPGERFNESYYWDTYFVNRGLLKTGHFDLAYMHAENFLFLIKNYGIIPNGGRNYYLSRSQPPLLTSMIRDLLEAAPERGVKQQEIKSWLQASVFELLEKEYVFWMTPDHKGESWKRVGRYNPTDKLNHHNDQMNEARPERSKHDKETELGLTFRDVRAEAESGKDFTNTMNGQATRVAPVLLNSIMFKMELDLAHFAHLMGNNPLARQYEQAAQRRRTAMNKLMWDEQAGIFRDRLMSTETAEGILLPYVTADVYATLFFGVATPEQALHIRNATLSGASGLRLEQPGGIQASNLVGTGKQWDGPFGWAPHQVFAQVGLKKYGFVEDAMRLAHSWLNANSRILQKTGYLIEKVDTHRADSPIEDGGKYKTQKGFGWTNGSIITSLIEILGLKVTELKMKCRTKTCAHR